MRRPVDRAPLLSVTPCTASATKSFVLSNDAVHISLSVPRETWLIGDTLPVNVVVDLTSAPAADSAPKSLQLCLVSEMRSVLAQREIQGGRLLFKSRIDLSAPEHL